MEKFGLMKGSKFDDVDSLKKIYSLTIRVEEFSGSMRKYEMGDVFCIPQKFSIVSGKDRPDGTDSVNILMNYGDVTVTIDHVKRASQWFMKWGQEYKVQNLFWSGNKLLNSCSTDL